MAGIPGTFPLHPATSAADADIPCRFGAAPGEGFRPEYIFLLLSGVFI
jgi:hypothetical protein